MRAKLLWIFLLLPSLARAVVSMGSISENITEPIEIVSGFVSVGCLVVGVSCLFAAIIKYFEYRRSPLAVPISKVVWLLILGFALLILPFAYLITGQGVPFAFLWGGS